MTGSEANDADTPPAAAMNAVPKQPRQPGQTPRAKEEAARRKEREAAALRENLLKRRGQSRARAGEDPGKA
jgi:hypothetical protein